MVLLICMLKDYRLVEELLLGYLEMGVTGATVLEGRGLGQIVGSEVPIFAGLRGLFPGSAADTHCVLSLIPNERIDPCLALINTIAGPLDTPGSGIVFTLPVNRALGLASEIE